ncbi:c-type cytochrome [Kyrpidia spormannii]|uniref:Cytochrome C n=1 Tax=Kyrpidia spormannii TaxID=2055160 RepID=A0A6F9E170_9BACL|nr:c-type cytochrome [Kyrpidia spormannii]CAB3390230.1 Cytochrome C [Kyrpidia spormannii]
MGSRIALFSVAAAAAVLLSACTAPTTGPAPLKSPSPEGSTAVTFNPPSIDSVPNDENGKAIKLGYDLMNDTKKLLPNNVGNQLSCSSCHAQAGTVEKELSLVGVASVYPQYRDREAAISTLEDRVNQCLQRSMNGKPIPYDSTEMRAFSMYMSYISKGIPEGTNPPWRGQNVKIDVSNPNLQEGQKLYQQSCAPCHGANGEGTPAGPAVWGPNSFNDGAGMANLSKMAAFVKVNMPKAPMGGENPGALTDAQARDVSAWILSHDRPHFPGKSKDFPKGRPQN